jgi:hypothetical protein
MTDVTEPTKIHFNLLQEIQIVAWTIIWFIFWNLWRMKWSLVVGGAAFLTIYASALDGKIIPWWQGAGLMFVAVFCGYIDGWDMRQAMRLHFRRKHAKQDAWFKRKMAEIEDGK